MRHIICLLHDQFAAPSSSELVSGNWNGRQWSSLGQEFRRFLDPAGSSLAIIHFSN